MHGTSEGMNESAPMSPAEAMKDYAQYAINEANRADELAAEYEIKAASLRMKAKGERAMAAEYERAAQLLAKHEKVGA